jgi:probable rRNA maturation factor
MRNPRPKRRSERPSGTASLLDVAVSAAVDDPPDVARIASAVRASLAESCYRSGAVSVAVVDDAAIRDLNRQFLNHDYATDVLSFPLVEQPPRVEGEIVVSIDAARRAAEQAGWTADDELLLYVVHGALHLAGHRDKRPTEARAMRAAELRVLAALGVAPHPGDSRWNGKELAS